MTADSKGDKLQNEPEVTWHSSLGNGVTRVQQETSITRGLYMAQGEVRLIYIDNGCYYCAAELWWHKSRRVFQLGTRFIPSFLKPWNTGVAGLNCTRGKDVLLQSGHVQTENC